MTANENAPRGEGGAQQTDVVISSLPHQKDIVNPNYSSSLDFLAVFHPGGPWVLTAIEPDGPGVVTRTFSQLEDVRPWLEEYNGRKRWGTYFTVNPILDGLGLKSKAARTDIKELAWLYVDIDPQAGEDIVEERERIQALLTTSLPEDVPPPTTIVFSGGGLQGFWKLKEPFPIDGDLERANEAALWNKGLEIAFGADSCHNVDRVMRIPGTINYPNAKKRKRGQKPAVAKVVHESDESHDVATFPKPASPAIEGPPQRGRVDIDVPKDVRRLAPEELKTLPVADWCKATIVKGEHPDDPAKWDSRSEALFAVVCEFVRHEVEDEVTYSIITDQNLEISASVLGNPSPERYALRQIERAKKKVAEDGADFIRSDEKKRVFPTLIHNVLVALRKGNISVRYNELSDRFLVDGIQDDCTQLTDNVVTILRHRFQEEYAVTFTPSLVLESTQMLGRENSFHPVRDYLDSLKWDGVSRLDRWIIEYAGAEDSGFVRAISAITLIAAVRRARKPGCKFDEMLILEGEQGLGKSSLFRILASEDWFSDHCPIHSDSKTFIEATQGKWILEVGELSSLKKSDVEHLKSVLSRTHDRARMAYARTAEDRARQFIIVGSTNEETYLADATGNRRYWPIHVGSEIRLEELQRDRDQLWAEAAERESQGESIRLARGLWKVAAEAQNARLKHDPWQDTLGDHLSEWPHGKISSIDLFRLLELGSEKQSPYDFSRVSAVMKRLGWRNGTYKFKGQSKKGYVIGDGGPELEVNGIDKPKVQETMPEDRKTHF